MKITISFFCILIFSTGLKSQNMDAHFIDSMLAIPQTLTLKIASPQPRLKEKVEISLDVNYVKAQIFKTEIGKFEVAEDIGNSNENLMMMKVAALIKGKQSMGPLSFIMNGTKYTTNKIEYEVIEPLPNVNKGLWFRKVVTSDTTFCIIIEQRIPANSKVTKISKNATKYWTEPTHDNICRFKNSYSIDGLNGGDGATYSDFGYITDEKAVRKEYMAGYSITHFRIKDKNKKIIITKDKFENVPVDYKYENIIVQ
jgi:hypothetical protein